MIKNKYKRMETKEIPPTSQAKRTQRLRQLEQSELPVVVGGGGIVVDCW